MNVARLPTKSLIPGGQFTTVFHAHTMTTYRTPTVFYSALLAMKEACQQPGLVLHSGGIDVRIDDQPQQLAPRAQHFWWDFPMPVKPSTLPPLIAIVGCDGSGKSTVSEEILAWARGYGPAAITHLGKQQGNTGRSISKLPLVGKFLGRFIARKASTVHKSRTVNKAPDTFPAIVMSAFTLKRVRRFRRMMALRQKGLIIIADRYPQLDIPGTSDSTDMSVAAQGNRFVRWLAQREQAAFEWMTSYRPDLVIRLNVDIDTAFARKPDHSREGLERKIRNIPQLTFNGAPITEIDATQPLAEVVAAAKAAVTQTLTEHGYDRS